MTNILNGVSSDTVINLNPLDSNRSIIRPSYVKHSAQLTLYNYFPSSEKARMKYTDLCKSINFDFDTYIAIGEKGRLIRHIFRLCLKQYIETNGACSHLAKTTLKRGFDWFGVFAFEIKSHLVISFLWL